MALALACLLALALPPAQATYPGRPGVIVFNHIPTRKNGAYVGGLYATRPDWKHPRRLTDNAWDDEASFAPSGRRLVFSRGFEPDPGIYTLDLRNDRTKRLTEGQGDRGPAFGPHGMIAFSRRSSPSEAYDLFLRNAAGQVRRLTSTPADDVDPVFTPDGSQILFSQEHLGGYPSDEPPPPRKISSIRPDGGGLRDIKGLTDAAHVDVSPDGRDLVFQRPKRLPNGEAELKIWTRPLTGGRPKLAAVNALIPAYSPNGKKIVFSIFRELWLLGAAGRDEPRQLTEWDAVGILLEEKLTTEPAWQPLPQRR